MVEAREIQSYLPHRFPFLLVDRVLEIDLEAGRLVAIKNLSVNEPFFQGHFPGYPVMPGVLMAEALAQAGGILVAQRAEGKGRIGFLAGLDKFRFRRPVQPGDQLRLEVKVTRLRSTVATFECRATVDGEVAAEGEIMVILAPQPA
ncbi:MAG: 3-hydroxyacyl-ACP dehydratase FabZ [Chloroflexota bacterium]